MYHPIALCSNIPNNDSTKRSHTDLAWPRYCSPHLLNWSVQATKADLTHTLIYPILFFAVHPDPDNTPLPLISFLPPRSHPLLPYTTVTSSDHDLFTRLSFIMVNPWLESMKFCHINHTDSQKNMVDLCFKTNHSTKRFGRPTLINKVKSSSCCMTLGTELHQHLIGGSQGQRFPCDNWGKNLKTMKINTVGEIPETSNK